MSSATDRTRTAGTALRWERTPSCSAAKAIHPSQALELQRHSQALASLCRDVCWLGSPAQLLRPLRAHILCEKNSVHRAGLITCAGEHSGKKLAAAAKLQLCKDRALKSEQRIPSTEQRGLSDWSGNGSSTRPSRRELPTAPALPRDTAAPSRRAAQVARCTKASLGSTASRAAKSTYLLTQLPDS